MPSCNSYQNISNVLLHSQIKGRLTPYFPCVSWSKIPQVSRSLNFNRTQS